MAFPQTRMRRLRKTAGVRGLVAETDIAARHLVWPVFVVPGKNVREAISSMPGVFHFSVDELVRETKGASGEGIRSFLLFGVPTEKDEQGKEAMRADSIVPQAIRAIKDVLPESVVITDVCLCGYLTHGHCGLVDNRGTILNDASLEVLSGMALAHARAGADIVAPSDMMDGRVATIRRVLDRDGLTDVGIMSYAAKFASAFYGPFRDAAHSRPAFGDRRTYQMDPGAARQALREMELDIEEGADIVMVKPALPYLDIVRTARDEFCVPIAAYQVSGEYSMIKAAAARGWLDEEALITESLTAIRRAGADIIISYFARDYARQR